MSFVDNRTLPHRSALYYEASSDLIIKSSFGDALYGCTEADICGESPVILEELANGRLDAPNLGKDDCTPLVLAVSADDLEALLALRTGKCSASTNFFTLVHALQTATYFRMKSTRRRAIALVASHKEFPRAPHALLRLSYLTGVLAWFHDSYQSLVLKPTFSLSKEELKAIGLEILWYVIASRGKIEDMRHLTIFAGPKFERGSGCVRQGCMNGWGQFWDTVVVNLLLKEHEVTRTLFMELLNQAPAGVCRACYQHNLTALCDSGVLDTDRKIARIESGRAWGQIFRGRRGAGEGEEDTR